MTCVAKRAAWAAVVTLALMLTPASADFGEPFNLSPAGRVDEPTVAIDANGNALIVWLGHDGATWRVLARAWSAAGVRGPVHTISPEGQGGNSIRVAMNADGNAVIVWRSSADILARARSAAGVLGPVETLSGPGENSGAQVGIDRNGNALVVWLHQDPDGALWRPRVQARARSATGVLGPIWTLSHPQQNSGVTFTPNDADVAIDANGNALVVWSRDDGANWRVQMRAHSSGGMLGPVQTLSRRGQHSISPRVAIDARGNALIVWRSSGLLARTRSAAGVLGQEETVSKDGQSARVAMNARGDALIAWYGITGPYTPEAIRARARSAAGTLGPLLSLGGAFRIFTSPRPAIDANGNGLIVWGRARDEVEARTLSATGVLGEKQTLSDSGMFPRVAMNAVGKTLVVWRTAGDQPFRIQGAVGP
jgi:hypothetical protein